MSELSLHPLPSARRALFEQIRAVGLALRLEMRLLAAGLVLLSGYGLYEAIKDRDPLNLTADVTLFIAVLGLAVPFGVWRDEKVFADTHLWTLPVDRAVHVLAKVFAGWVWLLAAGLAVLLWLVALSLVTGGVIAPVETRVLATLDEPVRAIGTIRWKSEPWQWLVPFTAATAVYLLVSAVVLGVRFPVRWAAAVALGFFFVLQARPDAFAETLLEHLFNGRFGLDYLLSGGLEGLDTALTLPDGGQVTAWTGRPRISAWALSTGFWLALGLTAVSAAALRHRER